MPINRLTDFQHCRQTNGPGRARAMCLVAMNTDAMHFSGLFSVENRNRAKKNLDLQSTGKCPYHVLLCKGLLSILFAAWIETPVYITDALQCFYFLFSISQANTCAFLVRFFHFSRHSLSAAVR